MLPPRSTTRTATGAPTAAAPPHAAAAATLAPQKFRQRSPVRRTIALPHLLAAVAALIGGTAYSGEQGRQRFTFRGNTLVAPRASQGAPRRGTTRCLADGGLVQGHTVYHTASLLQAASLALASPWPADQPARWPPCPLLTSTACTNLVSQLSLVTMLLTLHFLIRQLVSRA